VRTVNYPGLESHPHHARARAWLGGGGGLLSFELAGDVAAAEQLLARVSIPLVAPSLGGPETLITRPATTSHAGLAPDVRRRQGISDQLIRLSVGLESTADLIEDFTAALG
jgi:cystathionine beta-lyase/cystathionine gamma-synthase